MDIDFTPEDLSRRGVFCGNKWQLASAGNKEDSMTNTLLVSASAGPAGLGGSWPSRRGGRGALTKAIPGAGSSCRRKSYRSPGFAYAGLKPLTNAKLTGEHHRLMAQRARQEGQILPGGGRDFCAHLRETWIRPEQGSAAHACRHSSLFPARRHPGGGDFLDFPEAQFALLA